MAKKRAPRTFGIAYLILDPKGAVAQRWPRIAKQQAIDDFVRAERWFHDGTWAQFYREGYRCMKVLMTEVLK